MPITIQLGEVADRLRRAFAVRGRIPIGLDETMVPVAIMADTSQVPYATDPALGSSRHTDAALAANFSHVGWEAAVGSIVVVDSVLVHNPNAGAASFRIGITTAPTKDASSNVICVSRPFVSPGTPRRISALRFDRTAVAQLISAAEGSVTLAAGASILINSSWVLQAPDAANAMALVVAGEVVNSAVEAWARMREFGLLSA